MPGSLHKVVVDDQLQEGDVVGGQLGLAVLGTGQAGTVVLHQIVLRGRISLTLTLYTSPL